MRFDPKNIRMVVLPPPWPRKSVVLFPSSLDYVPFVFIVPDKAEPEPRPFEYADRDEEFKG